MGVKGLEFEVVFINGVQDTNRNHADEQEII